MMTIYKADPDTSSANLSNCSIRHDENIAVKKSSPVHYHFKIKSTTAQITKTVQYCDDLLRRHQWGTPHVQSELCIALSEALANAIIHGNRNDPEKFVQLKIRLDEKQVKISVMDQGPGFDHRHLPDPLADDNIKKRNGRGIYLMSALVDSVKFSRRAKGMEVTLLKSLPNE
ncbi:MAG: ATP-binding protein [candidate division KSB1 bacterium]|nr:ATP-binding protein [candidate division KSB1 bacterium]MDZ7318228.1 ATP-binding protein [candidate division KSB1 bacterium]MDZ7341174.1 ATP-binding protein [candidate division KSB1 bacterium]